MFHPFSSDENWNPNGNRGMNGNIIGNGNRNENGMGRDEFGNERITLKLVLFLPSKFIYLSKF